MNTAWIKNLSLRTVRAEEQVTDPKVIDSTYKYWRLRILIGTYVGYATFYLTRKSFTFIMPKMLSSLHYTAAELGILSSAFYITYGISKFISGMLSDKSNPRVVMAVGLMMTGIANILFGLSTSLLLLVIFWIANGYFQGWGWPPCARLLTHWYSQKERGIWWGIWNTSHNVGGALIPILVAVSAAMWGWRAAMYIPGVIAIIISFFLLYRLRDVPASMGLPPVEEYKNDRPQVKAARQQKVISAKRILFDFVLNNKYIWILAASYTLVYIVRTAINDWGAVFLTQRGFSLVSADSAISFFEVGGFFGSLVAGWASDKLFKGCRGQTNVIYSVGIIVMIVLLSRLTGSSYVSYASVIFGIGFLVFGPQMLIGMAAAELSHKEAAGTATGFVGLFAYIGAAVSGLPVGLIIQNYSWDGFFLFIGICSVLTVVLLAFMWSVKSNPKDAGVKETREVDFVKAVKVISRVSHLQRIRRKKDTGEK